LTWGNDRKPGRDDGLAQLEDDALERRLGLGAVPGLVDRTVVTSAGSYPHRAYQAVTIDWMTIPKGTVRSTASGSLSGHARTFCGGWRRLGRTSRSGGAISRVGAATRAKTPRVMLSLADSPNIMIVRLFLSDICS
jgi:hypothetical protein